MTSLAKLSLLAHMRQFLHPASSTWKRLYWHLEITLLQN